MMRARAVRHRLRRNGFALVIVLWSLVFLGLIAAHLVAAGRTEINLARNIAESAKAEGLADAGIARGVFQLLQTPKERWEMDGSTHDLDLPGGHVTIAITSEDALVNPNKASPALMAALLQLTGADSATAGQLSAAIAEFVKPPAKPQTPPGSQPGSQPGSGPGQAETAPDAPDHAPLESVDEIGFIPGMTPEILAAVRPYLTVYSDTEQPDPQYASPTVARALAIAATAPAAGRQGTQPGGNVPGGNQPGGNLPGGNTPAGNSAAPPAPGAAGGPGFALNANIPHGTARLRVRAVTPSGAVFVREAVVRLDPMAPKAYAIMGWWRRSDEPAP